MAVVAVALMLAACDPISSVEYNIHNMTSDTVSITFHKELMTSAYQGFEIEENDSVTTRYDSDSITSALLAPNQHLKIHKEWHGLYREDQMVHAWMYIKSIMQGQNEVDSKKWDNEAAWHHRTKGGGNFAKDESHYYDLWFRE